MEILEIENNDMSRVACEGCLKTFASVPNLKKHMATCQVYQKNTRIEELENENSQLKEYIQTLMTHGCQIQRERDVLLIQNKTIKSKGQTIINGLMQSQQLLLK